MTLDLLGTEKKLWENHSWSFLHQKKFELLLPVFNIFWPILQTSLGYFEASERLNFKKRSTFLCEITYISNSKKKLSGDSNPPHLPHPVPLLSDIYTNISRVMILKVKVNLFQKYMLLVQDKGGGGIPWS